MGNQGLLSAIKILKDRKNTGKKNLIAIIDILLEEMELIEVLDNKKDNSPSKMEKLLYFSQRVSKVGLSDFFQKPNAYTTYYNHLIAIFDQISEVPLYEKIVNKYQSRVENNRIKEYKEPPF